MHICSSSEYSSESRIPIINNPDEKTIYLVPASYQPSNNMFTEWVYVNNTWEIFGSVAVDLSGYLTDVQVDGTSIVTNGVAEIPLTSRNIAGVIAVDPFYGHDIIGGKLTHKPAASSTIKSGTDSTDPIVSKNQHESAFYGLAKVAGHDEKNSALPLGTYSEEAKSAIRTMLGLQDVYEDYSSALTALGVIE